MTTDNVITLASVIVAVLSLGFAVYTHFSSRRVARLLYELSQLSDYDVPESFLHGLPRALVVLKMESAGSKLAEHLVIRLSTLSNIVGHEVDPPGYAFTFKDQSVSGAVEKLNPGQRIRVLLYCDGAPTQNQISDLEVTHSEGVGIDRRSPAFSSVNFSFFGVELTYDMLARAISSIRFGPLRLR